MPTVYLTHTKHTTCYITKEITSTKTLYILKGTIKATKKSSQEFKYQLQNELNKSQII